MTESQENQQKRVKLPRLCECGGRLSYARGFGRLFVHCLSCTPVTTISLPDYWRTDTAK